MCAVDFNGPSIVKSHYDGKSHARKVQKKLEELIVDPEMVPKKRKIEGGDAPKPSSDATKTFCEICNVSCGNDTSFESHLNGRAHKARVQLIESGPGMNKPRCDLCRIEVSSAVHYEAHINGKVHKKKLAQSQAGAGNLIY